ncbi:MAG: DUF3343 domain-containing protein [Eggerthellaceae bacterium]|jgi:hypothetical protein|nr:DUF3343 domain-containing protein [Eggerthellaceae bacterium]MDR2715878.1 DUF3343 domain-containing protein [Coriobacteriaceae bacterium]
MDKMQGTPQGSARGRASGEGHGSTQDGRCAYLLAFDSTYAALVAQRALAKYLPHIIPTPRQVSAGCGMSVKFFARDVHQAQAIRRETGLDEDASTLYACSNESYHAVSC